MDVMHLVTDSLFYDHEDRALDRFIQNSGNLHVGHILWPVWHFKGQEF